MKYDILTIFPDIFNSYLSESIIKRAINKNLIEIHVHNIRDYANNKHNKVDDIIYGGGAGMLMSPEPLYNCIKEIKKTNKGPVIFLSPRGKLFTQAKAENYSKKHKEMILLCGRYEGIDQRIIDLLVDEELSIGKFVLTGGELPAMVLLDAVSRLIPGVLNKDSSHEEDSFSKNLGRKKEYPNYTRPEEFMGLKVPEVLLSGHHKNIEKWKKSKLK